MNLETLDGNIHRTIKVVSQISIQIFPQGHASIIILY
jgi:hypothetical protein